MTARPKDPWNEELFRTTKDPAGLSFRSWIAVHDNNNIQQLMTLNHYQQETEINQLLTHKQENDSMKQKYLHLLRYSVDAKVVTYREQIVESAA